MSNRKKAILITLISVAVLAAAAAGVWFLWLKDAVSAAGAAPVYVHPVSSIIGMETGANPRYSGIVEPQETYQIKKDDTKTVAEVLVHVGDEIHVGDVLFRYDNEAIAMELTQAEIDQEGIANQIATYQRQMKDLQDKLAKASKDDQYAYTVQINAIENQIKRQELDANKKQAEVEKLREDLLNTDVYSEVEGVVKEINSGSSADSQSAAFISVLSSGDYRVKGTVSELNVASLAVGQAVVVHSRLDPSVTWNGSVASIDQEAARSDTSNGYYFYGGADSGERSSKYNFYVTLADAQGLILGQHVYIEPDLGAAQRKEGLWLPAMYVAHDDEGSYVWLQNDREKLEKRVVILGEYDSEADEYEIKSGVTLADSIAFPTDELKPGMPTTTDTTYQAGPILDYAGGLAAEDETGGAYNGAMEEEDSSYDDWDWEDAESAGVGEGTAT